MRLLHTADWQLGLKLHFVAGEAGARARAQRFETVRAIGDLARREAVDCVVVAGDVLDDNAVGADTLELARDALATFAPVPVLLLPGNHDAATPDCALARLDAPAHVRVLLDTEPVELAGAHFHPCPLNRRHVHADPTAHLPARAPGDDSVRVAIAHGGVLDFGETAETPNLIDAARVAARGFDYLALGDWHGAFRASPRAWYPGAPEATRFKERRPGNVLLVDIAGAGAEPVVREVPVARTRWLTESRVLDGDADLEALAAWLDGLPERSWTLLSLTLSGSLSLNGRARLDALLDAAGERLLHLRTDLAGLTQTATAADLEALRAEGFVSAAAERLRAGADPADTDALLLLHRLMLETDAAPGR